MLYVFMFNIMDSNYQKPCEVGNEIETGNGASSDQLPQWNLHVLLIQ